MADSSAVPPGDSPFEGEWRNPIDSPRAITSVVIAKRDERWTVQVWWKCRPRDCQWEERPLHLSRTRSGNGFEGLAFWERGGLSPIHQVYFSIKAQKPVVEVRTIPRDDRPMCDWTGYFVRARS
jgi:hypothetical protein